MTKRKELLTLDLLRRVFINTIKLRCKNCSYIFEDYKFEEETNLKKKLVSGGTITSTLILKCPFCNKDWEKNCGVDFNVYPHIRKAVIENYSKRKP